MQEAIEQKTVLLIENCTKLTAEALERAIRQYLSQTEPTTKPPDTVQPQIYRGKQTLRQLSSQNAGLSNIEITNENIKAFSRVAKKYHVDYALKKVKTAEHPRYLVFFKSRDADAMTAAFQEFTARRMGHQRGSIHQQLAEAAEQTEQTQQREKTLDRELVR